MGGGRRPRASTSKDGTFARDTQRNPGAFSGEGAPWLICSEQGGSPSRPPLHSGGRALEQPRSTR